jgi:hypothetical protein
MGEEFLESTLVDVASHADVGVVRAGALPVDIKSALVAETIGLLPAEGFLFSTVKSFESRMLKRSLSHFENELIAVPANGVVASGFSAQADRHTDIGAWAMTPHAAQLAHPPLVWIGSSMILEGVSVMPGGRRARNADGIELDIKFVPPISANRAYVDSSTVRYFENRRVRMRGAVEEAHGKSVFVARTIWPDDFALDPSKLTIGSLRDAADIAGFVCQRDTPNTAVEARLLWERRPSQVREWKQKPVIGFVLNGAQSSGNASLGGHFAVATGRVGNNGEWCAWAVNNFYSLDSVNDKGIFAATVPMDKYLMDLNSGQQYYRPSYMLVAILSNQRTAAAFQGGVQRVFNHFYRQDFQYCHATANCAGISIDVFDSLGWRIPKRGAAVSFTSIAASAYVLAKNRSFAKSRKIFDYLKAEQTRLLPAVAFEAAGQDLLQIVGATGMPERALSAYEEQLRTDVEAILLIRIPQVPSGRAIGSAPAFSFDEFRSRMRHEPCAIPPPVSDFMPR